MAIIALVVISAIYGLGREYSQPAIIPPETFELAQEESRRRKAGGGYTSDINCFASRIVCGECGSFYGHLQV